MRESESNLRHMSSVDMSEWVTYILWRKSDKEVSVLYYWSQFGVSSLLIIFFSNLTMEAAHA